MIDTSSSYANIKAYLLTLNFWRIILHDLFLNISRRTRRFYRLLFQKYSYFPSLSLFYIFSYHKFLICYIALVNAVYARVRTDIYIYIYMGNKFTNLSKLFPVSSGSKIIQYCM